MKTVREVAHAVIQLRRDFEEFKKARFTCTICPEDAGCNSRTWPTNSIPDPIHANHKA